VESADVVVVGGGPGGSACARALVAHGLDVTVLDQARFPRDKVCAGWITPEVVSLLDLDPGDYAATRLFQPITAFRVGVLPGPLTLVDYGRPVSYGIRRVEFDEYLLRRAGAGVVEGTRVSAIERRDGRWVVNGRWSAPLLVGAGGHFCPVARTLNPSLRRERVIVAQECEQPIAVAGLDAGTPELYFAADLRGYAWLFPKGAWVNIGLGREDSGGLPGYLAGFVDALAARGRLPRDFTPEWRGHAYLVASASDRRVVGDGVLLLGDAAGLAVPASGEGIRCAVHSGLLAAEAILRARRGDTGALPGYAEALRARFGHGRRRPPTAWNRRWQPVRTAAIRGAFRWSWFARRVVLDRAFLGAA